jgi:hypothetical protein
MRYEQVYPQKPCPPPFLEEHLLAIILGRVGDVPEAASIDTL